MTSKLIVLRNCFLHSLSPIVLAGCAIGLQTTNNAACPTAVNAAASMVISTGNTVPGMTDGTMLMTLAPLMAAVTSNMALPEITADDMNAGSQLLATTKDKYGRDKKSNKSALLPLADEKTYSKFDAAVPMAKEARRQIIEIMSGIPVTSDKAMMDPKGPTENLGSVSKAHVSVLNQMSLVLGAGGYEALALASMGQMEGKNSSKLSSSTKTYLAQEMNTARFLATYYKAYFRDGHILQVSVDTADLAKGIENKVDEKVATVNAQLGSLTSISSADKNSIKTAINGLESDVVGGFKSDVGKICKSTALDGSCLLTKPLGDVSFVTRAGTSIQFSGESITFGENGKIAPATTKLSSTVVVPQLARVLWEAVFDSFPPFVPAMMNSTACMTGLYTNASTDLKDLQCVADTLDVNLSDNITSVDTDATTSESITTAAFGYLIRGVSVFSLNNEAVSQTIETSAGEIARKVTEKLVWNEVLSKCSQGPVHRMVTASKTY